MNSWFARLGSSMLGLRRCLDEPIDSWWRRLLRDGKRFWTKHSVDVVRAVTTAKFLFSGHIARMPGSNIAHCVLKVRHLAWWRARQAKIHSNRGPRPHDRRFNAQHRWEAPVEVFSGLAVASQPEVLVGCMQAAQPSSCIVCW